MLRHRTSQGSGNGIDRTNFGVQYGRSGCGGPSVLNGVRIVLAHGQRSATLATECYHLGDNLRRIIVSICIRFFLDSGLLADTPWRSKNNEWRLLIKPSTL